MQTTNRVNEFKEKLFRINMDDLIRETGKKAAPPKSEPKAWGIYLILGAILFALGAVMPKTHQEPAKTIVAAPTVLAPTPPPLPEVTTPRALPMPVPSTGQAPRAQLLHIRGIGTVENDRMPDGRVLTTRYMGELSSTAHLPTRGAQLGDMWFTRNDGHCWVLAPLPGSSTVGWIDP
jgi:hypothetical protein